MTEISSQIFEFGAFRMDAAHGRLTRGGETVRLSPRTFDVLRVLVRAGGDVVTRDALLVEVWGETFVEDGNLTVHISTLRRLLEADGTRYVETIPKRGYRLVAAVRAVAGDAPDALEAPRPPDEGVTAIVEPSEVPAGLATPAWIRRGSPWLGRRGLAAALLLAAGAVGTWNWNRAGSDAAQIRTLAVLPFDGLSGETAHLQAGMADALTTRLASVRALQVTPSVLVRPQVREGGPDRAAAARELGVDAFVTGAIQRAGDDIRVTVQVVRTGGGLVWGGRFDAPFTNIFAVQDEIAAQIASALVSGLSPDDQANLRRRETTVPQAYELYLRGREQWNRRTPAATDTAIQMYLAAIRLDPEFAAAYAGLADAYTSTMSRLIPSARFPLARAAAEKAVALDDRLAAAHTALAIVLYKADWQWRRAEEEFGRAIALDPSDSVAHLMYAEFLVRQGRNTEGIAELREALHLDPYSLAARGNLSSMLRLTGRLDEARRLIEAGLRQDGTSVVMHRSMAALVEAEGHPDEALELSLQARLLAGERAEDVEGLRDAYRSGGRPAYLRQENRLLLSRIEQDDAGVAFGLATSLANNFAALGNRDQTLTWLERATDRREDAPLQLIAPAYDFVRDDPRFQALVQRVGRS